MLISSNCFYSASPSLQKVQRTCLPAHRQRQTVDSVRFGYSSARSIHTRVNAQQSYQSDMVEIAKSSAKDRIEEEQVPVVVQSRLNRMPGTTPLRCSETITAYLEEGHELVARMKLTPASDERLVLMDLETAGRRYHGLGKMLLSMAAQRTEAKHQELFLTAAKGVWYGHLADKYQPNSRISPVPFYASVGFEPASSVTSEELKRFENGMADYKKAKALRPAVEPEAYRRFPDKLNMVLSGQPLKALAKKGPTIPQLEPPTEWLETSEK